MFTHVHTHYVYTRAHAHAHELPTDLLTCEMELQALLKEMAAHEATILPK